MAESASKRPAVLLSFDAEEFDIPLEYGAQLSESEQFRIGADGLERTLLLLGELDLHATFFTTAAIALHRPDLIRRAAAAGHEIASHAYFHSRFEPGDIARSRDVLRQISGTDVVGFRMPRMAPVDTALLCDAGYLYDSSTNPIWLPGRYNRFFAPRRPSREDGLIRIPLSAVPMVRWPLFWLAFKNQPAWLTRLTTSAVLRADGYAALYFHPWELMHNAGFGLPAVIAKLSGQSMYEALRAHLLWLRTRCRFITYADFARERFPS